MSRNLQSMFDAQARVISNDHSHQFTGDVIWTDEECFLKNRRQMCEYLHPYNCGNFRNHSPLIATRFGWKCPDCDYTQVH